MFVWMYIKYIIFSYHDVFNEDKMIDAYKYDIIIYYKYLPSLVDHDKIEDEDIYDNNPIGESKHCHQTTIEQLTPMSNSNTNNMMIVNIYIYTRRNTHWFLVT